MKAQYPFPCLTVGWQEKIEALDDLRRLDGSQRYLYTNPQLTIEHIYANIKTMEFVERQEGGNDLFK